MAAAITVAGTVVVAIIQHDRPQPSPQPAPFVQPAPAPVAHGTANVTGRWTGSASQILPDGSKRAYALITDLVQEGRTITGTTRQDLLGTNYFAVVSLNGQVSKDGSVHLQDLVIQQSFPIQGMQGVAWWYAKTSSLELSEDGNTLEGTWQTQGASGGTMQLKRH